MLTVITGPPASGKTTWVREHAKPGDIVIDYDVLAVALTAPGADSHDHPKVLRDVTWRARQAAIHEALKHATTVDVWIIHSQPTAAAMARYTEHHARIVTIDPGREVVTARIREQRRDCVHAIAARWYNNRRRATVPALAPPSRASGNPRHRAW